MRSLNWIIFVVGILAFVAPFVFGFSAMTAPFISNLIVGVLLVIFGVVAALSHNMAANRTLDWISAVVGLWLLISPFVLNLTSMTSALWANIILGIIAIVFGVWTAISEQRVAA